MSKLIAFTGSKGVGKSWCAKYASNKFRGAGIEVSFADPIKEMLFEIVGENVWVGDKEKPRKELGGKSIRYALQTLGTEWGRGMIYPDIWIDQFKRCVSAERELQLNVVNDDCRFDNEADAIHELGGVVVLVTGNSCYESGDGHSSEGGISMEKIDYVIDNDHTDQVKQAIETIIK